jgi:hypothetical protein
MFLMRAGRVYCNATQAKAWARFPRPFGPKSPSQGPSGRNRLQSPTGSQAIILSALRAPCAGWLTAGSKSSTKCGSTEPLTTLSSITTINFNTALGSFSSTSPNPSFFPLKTDRKSFGASLRYLMHFLPITLVAACRAVSFCSKIYR